MPDNCVKPAVYVPFGINVTIHVLILFTILSLFFMFYATKITRTALNNTLETNINNALDGPFNMLSPDAKQSIKSLTDLFPKEKIDAFYGKTEPLVEMHNKWLFRSIVMTNVALFLISVVAVLIIMYQCGQCVPIGEILLENGITFALVGVVEYLFFTKVVSQYIPTKPSLIVETFFNSLTKYL